MAETDTSRFTNSYSTDHEIFNSVAAGLTQLDSLGIYYGALKKGLEVVDHRSRVVSCEKMYHDLGIGSTSSMLGCHAKLVRWSRTGGRFHSL